MFSIQVTAQDFPHVKEINTCNIAGNETTIQVFEPGNDCKLFVIDSESGNQFAAQRIGENVEVLQTGPLSFEQMKRALRLAEQYITPAKRRGTVETAESQAELETA